VRPEPALPGCDIWDLAAADVNDTEALHLQFDAEGRVTFFR